jgi:ATP-binding cassette subfamily G (WHITE) protein 2 (PDR)
MGSVLASPDTLPRFWIFMYRVSPFTYLVDGMMSTSLANTDVVCADIEYLHFDPPQGMVCKDYLEDYIGMAGGYLTDATKNASSDCHFCVLADTNAFLKSVNSNYDDRWRNFGILFAFIIFNIFGAIFMYWLVRVPKNSGKEKEDVKKEKTEEPIHELTHVNTTTEKKE